MFNKVIMVGNLTRDIELRYLPSGTAIGNSGLATNRKFKVNGEPREEVCFIDITFFGRSAEIANQYLRRGSKVLIEGRLKFDQWSDQSGNKRSKHAITVETMQMLDSKRDDSYSNNNNNYSNSNQSNSYQSSSQNSNQNSFSNQGASTSTNNYYKDNDSGSSAASRATSNSSDASSSSNYTNNIPEIDIDEEDIPF